MDVLPVEIRLYIYKQVVRHQKSDVCRELKELTVRTRIIQHHEFWQGVRGSHSYLSDFHWFNNLYPSWIKYRGIWLVVEESDWEYIYEEHLRSPPSTLIQRFIEQHFHEHRFYCLSIDHKRYIDRNAQPSKNGTTHSMHHGVLNTLMTYFQRT